VVFIFTQAMTLTANFHKLFASKRQREQDAVNIPQIPGSESNVLYALIAARFGNNANVNIPET
jgi:hypothetical protein